MGDVAYRQASQSDIPAMARIRTAVWESEDFWRARVSAYLAGESNPQHALAPRMMYVALRGGCVVGFAAGHLTRRYACHGELQWIDVIREQRRTGIASQLLCCLATWFAEKKQRGSAWMSIQRIQWHARFTHVMAP